MISLLYLLASVVLFAIAVVIHFNISALSLPIPSALSILVAILPIVGFINSFVYPSLLYASRRQKSAETILARLIQLTPFILQVLQALFATVLATLLAEDASPSGCLLETQWLGYYRSHDGQAIRRVQDALSCCGFNSIRDRAYPFQHDGAASTCPETYGRDTACRDLWAGTMRSNAGADLAIVLVTELLQLIGLLMMREGTNWYTSWGSRRWDRLVGGRRPLLPATQDDDGHASNPENGGYGAVDEAGPRVEPSPIHERNAWEER